MKIILGVVLISGLVVAGGCATVPPSAASCGPQPAEQQITASVQAYIAGTNWKDPDSVRTRNVVLQPCRSIWNGFLNGGGHTIGWEIDFEVNAKNSYGGYTGFQLRSIIRTADGKVSWDPEGT